MFADPPALSFVHVTDLVELLLRAAESAHTLPATENGQPGKGRYFACLGRFQYGDLHFGQTLGS